MQLLRPFSEFPRLGRNLLREYVMLSGPVDERVHCCKWRLPKIGVRPNHPFIAGIFPELIHLVLDTLNIMESHK